MVDGKSSDKNIIGYRDERLVNSYVPSDCNIGGGDYIKINICLKCGQLQGKWPVKDPSDFGDFGDDEKWIRIENKS
jgi:hypothetical protein